MTQKINMWKKKEKGRGIIPFKKREKTLGPKKG